MKRILGLDIVRAFAILQVVFVHSTYVFPSDIKNLILNLIPAIDGVSIFFVLSGYLIGGILFKAVEKERFTFSDLTQFWIRRWFRTLPNYFLILLILLLYDIFIYNVKSECSFLYLFFAQNLVNNHPDFFPEAWSLSVEEWFYFLFPLVCFVGFKVVRTKRYFLLVAALCFLIAPFLLRVFIQINDESESLVVRKIVVYRLDSIMYGIIGAYIFRYYLTLWQRVKYFALWISAFLIVALTVYHNFFKHDLIFWRVYSFNIESLAILFCLPYFSDLQEIKVSSAKKLFTFISRISYSMYILNLSIVQWRVVPIFLSLTNLTELDSRYSGILSYIIFWPLLFIGSYILFYFYELPMMNLRDKIKFSQS